MSLWRCAGKSTEDNTRGHEGEERRPPSARDARGEEPGARREDEKGTSTVGFLTLRTEGQFSWFFRMGGRGPSASLRTAAVAIAVSLRPFFRGLSLSKVYTDAWSVDRMLSRDESRQAVFGEK